MAEMEEDLLEGIARLFIAEDVRNLCCPRQLDLEHVPVYEFDLAHASRDFAASVEARLGRARLMAPILIGKQQIPVLPLSNPETGVSHHILRIFDSREDSRCHNYKLDLLFQDTDLYFAGFRHCAILMEEEVWGEWFIYKDMLTNAAFLNPVKMGISSAHSKANTAIGGLIAMEDLFFTLCKFEEKISIHDPLDGSEWRWVRMSKKVKADLEKAVARVIIVFAEALRLRSLYLEVLRCLANEYLFNTIRVKECFWNLINNWGKLSEYLQTLRKEGVIDNLDAALPVEYRSLYEFSFPTMTLNDLIGPEGEIMVAKCEWESFISEADKLIRFAEAEAANFTDPKFSPSEEDVEGVMYTSN